MRKIRISVSQNNFTVGDINGNLEKIKDGIECAVKDKADIVIFPELAVPGYPPEDLVFKSQFIDSNLEAIKKLSEFSAGKDILIITGFINKIDDDIYNAAAIIYQGGLIDTYHKIYLPNYGVFDEKRYFTSGGEIPVYLYKGIKLGINICEDIWYSGGPLHFQALAGSAEIAVNISASPYHAGKQEYREKMFSTRAGDESVILINCNLTGGQDELVFDGASTAYNENGDLIMRMKSFEEDFAVFDVDADAVFRKRLKDIRRRQERTQNVYLQNNCLQNESQFNDFRIKEIEILRDISKKDHSFQKETGNASAC